MKQKKKRKGTSTISRESSNPENKNTGKSRGKTVFTFTKDGETKKFVRSSEGQEPRVEFHNPPKPDSEKTTDAPDDEYAALKYPPPKKHPIFRKKWGAFIDSLVSRDNFKVGHLNNLEILCDLYVEYAELQEFIRTHGRSYVSVGRNGEAWKFYPEVGQLTRVQANIKTYTAMLRLEPSKDYGTASGGEESEWE